MRGGAKGVSGSVTAGVEGEATGITETGLCLINAGTVALRVEREGTGITETGLVEIDPGTIVIIRPNHTPKPKGAQEQGRLAGGLEKLMRRD